MEQGTMKNEVENVLTVEKDLKQLSKDIMHPRQ